MSKKREKAKPMAADAQVPGERLMPPPNGVTVRMYRPGHGDCFLLAFAGEVPEKPVYVLIDCGYKPGSPAYIRSSIATIAKNIHDATDGHINVAVLTHEHQDHLNGINAAHFGTLDIDETWLAWTEDSTDDLANSLRQTFKDTLLGLIAARNRLQAAGGTFNQLSHLDQFLEFEFGGDAPYNTLEAENMLKAKDDPGNSKNKQAMKFFISRSKNGPRYLYPHKGILTIPGAKDLHVFVLGPPHDEKMIEDLDPRGAEGFDPEALAATSPASYFLAAAQEQPEAPFFKRYYNPFEHAADEKDYGKDAKLFAAFYGNDTIVPSHANIANLLGDPSLPALERGENEIPDNPAWRRIDHDWLSSSAELGLAINDYTNNSSLVLAFELGVGGKVLLFAADAQRGNWVSWALKDWTDGSRTVTARDLLSRTVLYKVGHHGSHNATLKGTADSKYPNLDWMAQGDYANEFTAMITAVRAWAINDPPHWNHPLPSIKAAITKKASGRVFQTDTEFDDMKKALESSQANLNFLARAKPGDLYFDYTITP